MANTNWDDHGKYLAVSRSCIWNMDYMEFLIEKVWRITQPVRVADLGCGIGYLGEVMMPLLPKGSTYTGFDQSVVLLDMAKERLSALKCEISFKQADLTTDELPSSKFDLVICQTVLQHVPNGLSVIDKMKHSVVEGGLVICCEISRNLANAGLYFDGYDIDQNNNLGILQKLWYNDLHNTGVDSTIGVKIPAYMRKIGLKDVGIRVNDYMHVVDPYQDETSHQTALDVFFESWGSVGQAEKQPVVDSLMKRGLSQNEAEHQWMCEKELSAHIQKHARTSYMMIPIFMLISFGKK